MNPLISLLLYITLLLSLVTLVQCDQPSKPRISPPSVNLAEEIPQWITQAGLGFPNSIAYKSGQTIVQKTIESRKAITDYYKNLLEKKGYSIISELNQKSSTLLQYKKQEQKEEKTNTVITIEISKLSYAQSHLIRLGKSKVTIPADIP